MKRVILPIILSAIFHKIVIFDSTEDNHAANKSSVDSLSGDNRIGRDMSTVFIDQNNPFDEKI